MMKTIRLLLVFAALILVISLISPVKGQTSAFVISGADATNTLNTESPSSLSELLDQSSPRIVIEYANTSKYHLLETIPTALDNLLQAIETRIIIEFANTNKIVSLTKSPAVFNTLLDNLNSRIVFQFANANRQLTYEFPKELIGDSKSPQIKNINILPRGVAKTTITWTTDELSNSKVECGTTPGEHTITVADSLYVEQHTIQVDKLSPSTKYFCMIYSTDISDNIAEGTAVEFIQPETSFYYLQLYFK